MRLLDLKFLVDQASQRTSMNSQFSAVRFSSVALAVGRRCISYQSYEAEYRNFKKEIREHTDSVVKIILLGTKHVELTSRLANNPGP